LIIRKRVAELQLKQVKALRYPTIRVNTGYTFSDSQSSLGFTTQSTSRGNYGFSASLNLFWLCPKPKRENCRHPNRKFENAD
jgi:outer membrane protein TolC